MPKKKPVSKEDPVFYSEDGVVLNAVNKNDKISKSELCQMEDGSITDEQRRNLGVFLGAQLETPLKAAPVVVAYTNQFRHGRPAKTTTVSEYYLNNYV